MEVLMSKPRYRWWSYAKAMIRNYPALVDRYIQGPALREREAVQRAIDQTEQMVDGKERLQVIDLVFFRQTHTLEGAAMMIPCGYETAKRWQQQFIKCVARNQGLLDETITTRAKKV